MSNLLSLYPFNNLDGVVFDVGLGFTVKQLDQPLHFDKFDCTQTSVTFDCA